MQLKEMSQHEGMLTVCAPSVLCFRVFRNGFVIFDLLMPRAVILVYIAVFVMRCQVSVTALGFIEQL